MQPHRASSIDVDRKAGAVAFALVALARFTFPGLEPGQGSVTTGYACKAGGLGVHSLDALAGLASLLHTRHAMRVGRNGWCITKSGRELARSLFGDGVLAQESAPDGRGRRYLIEGAPRT